MRRRVAALTVLLALACNEVLGLDAGKLGSLEGGGGNSAGSPEEGGSTPSAGNDSGRGGSSAGAGNVSTGGAGGDASCSTTADCVENGLAWPPHLCLAGACVDVLTEECDTLLGAEGFEERLEDKPIVFGALADKASMGAPADDASAGAPSVDELSASYSSLELAMKEFTEYGLLPIDGALRRPLLLLCRGSADPASIKQRLDHLLDDVGVPGVVLLQSPLDVLTSVEYAFTQKEADVFFIDVGPTSELLTIIPDGGRLWHMLGQASDFKLLFEPLVKLVEQHVNPGGGTGHSNRLTRLVLVPPVENEGFESVMARSVEGNVRINNLWLEDNPKTYKKVTVEAMVGEGPFTAARETAEFKPDIVIDFAGINELIDDYVAQASLGRVPFYILPPSQAHSPVLSRRVLAGGSLQTRVVGVRHAGPDEEHQPLYDAYLERLAAISQVGVDGSGSANVYEAVYFLIYAAVAGGTGGANMNTGMTRLVDLATDSRRDIGPTTIDSVLDLLRSDQTLSLHGALGPPAFYPQSGGRNLPTSVWCINEDSEYVMDALYLVPAEIIGVDLDGPFPCFFLAGLASSRD